MKDIVELFDRFTDKLRIEASGATAMRHSMAMREFLLLNLSTDELGALANAIRLINVKLETDVTDGHASDRNLLITMLPELFTSDSVSELPEETIMLLTNLTVDYLLECSEFGYNTCTTEEYLSVYRTIRPLVQSIMDEDVEYTPLSFTQYKLYLTAIETMKANKKEIANGNLDALKPLYSAELMNVEPAVDSMYEFTTRLRYDLALIWAIRKKYIKITPIIKNDTPVDWEMEISETLGKHSRAMLDSVLKEMED